MIDLKEYEEKSWFRVFYHSFTTPGLPPQPPHNANFGIFCPILIIISVEVNLLQIWRKMKRNPDSECFITPGLPPQPPQNTNFGIFCPILIKFGVEVKLWQIRRKMKSNPDLESFITPLPPPAQNLKMLT